MECEISTLDGLRQSTAAACSRQTIARIMGLDPRTVTAGIHAGTIPAIRIGRRVLIPRERFLAMFDIARPPGREGAA